MAYNPSDYSTFKPSPPEATPAVSGKAPTNEVVRASVSNEGASGPKGPEPWPTDNGSWRANPVEAIERALWTYRGGGGPDAEDDLFSPHTGIVIDALRKDTNLDVPVKLWKDRIAALVSEAEKRNHAVIHKGAPFYNNALCLFRLGDFDRAYSYFSKAAAEDTLNRGTDPSRLFTGNHPLSPKVLIDPLFSTLLPHHVVDYRAVTSQTLDETELKSLLSWLSVRLSDAMQVLMALHRIQRTLLEEDDTATSFIRVRAIGELHVAVESALRQHGIGVSQLFDRLQRALATNPNALSAFNDLHSWFIATFPAASRETAATLNQLLAEADNRFAGTAAAATKAGIAAYAVVRVRNSILHLNEEGLDIFKSRPAALKIVGWALSTCRTVQHAEQGTLAAL